MCASDPPFSADVSWLIILVAGISAWKNQKLTLYTKEIMKNYYFV